MVETRQVMLLCTCVTFPLQMESGGKLACTDSILQTHVGVKEPH